MQCSKIKNTGSKNLTVVLDDNTNIHMPPGAEMENVNVTNLSEIRGNIDVTQDLSEIKRHGIIGQRLDD
jgi:hypothetical protein